MCGNSCLNYLNHFFIHLFNLYCFMNIRNLSGLKYLALMLLAAFTFTSCEEETFTAEEAYALEEQRLQLLEQFARDRSQQQFDNEMAMRRFQNTVDSLRRINAGGRVLYTAVFVPGESSVFTGGRMEEAEGLAGVTVTVEQFGITTQVTTDDSGVASFLLYSGEVTVNASVNSYTDANYVANLTPDGGVPNSTVAHVGNVIPVFFNDANAADAQDRMAMIAGRFFAETDVTNFQEEVMLATGTSDGKQYLAGRPGVAAYIDPNDAFRQMYLRENFEEGFDINGNITRSGFIQRIAYETAGGVARPNATGDYQLMVPATGSGLQTRMEYSEFVANRTFVSFSPFDFQGGDVIGGAFGGFLSDDNRTLYGPNVTPDVFPTAADLFAALFGVIPNTTVFSFLNSDGVLNETNFTIAPATVTATISSTGALQNPTISGGAYVLAPTVTFPAPSAGGTAATVQVRLTNTTVTANAGVATALRTVEIVPNSFTAGSGYTTADLTSGVVRATVTPQATGVTGTGTIQRASNSLNTAFVRILDGGFGFANADINGLVPGRWTGISPWVNYPTGVGAPTGTNAITATYLYDDGGIGTTTGNGFTYTAPGTTSGQAFSTVQEIRINAGGDNWTGATLAQLNAAPFKYELSTAQIPVVDNDGDFFFTVNANGGLAINPLYGPNGGVTLGAAGGVTSATTANFATAIANNFVGPANFSVGAGYVFVPNVTVQFTGTGNAPNAAITVGAYNDAVVAARGTMKTFDVGGSNGFTTANQVTSIIITTPTNSLNAQFFTSGGSVDNYTIAQNITPNLAPAANIITNPSVNATGGGLSAVAYDFNTGTAGNDDAQRNTYVALFSAPAEASGTRAYGYPVFDATKTRVIGVEMFNGGIGYSTTQNITWEMIPVDRRAATVSATLAPSRIVFNVTDGGRYALTPRIRVFEGGSFAFDFATATPTMNPDGSIRSIATINNAITGGGPNNGQPFTGQLSVVIDTDLPEIFSDNRLNGFFTGLTVAPGGFYHLAGSGVNPQPIGSLTGIQYLELQGGAVNNRGADPEAGEMWESANWTARETFVAGQPAWITNFFINIGGLAGGTGAVADIEISPINGHYVATTLRTGGQGYLTQIRNNNEEANQGFRVLGGPDGNTTRSALNVFTGLSYVRDIHYGSGQLLE